MDHTVLLVRHGITDWNRERRLQGLSDNPLSEEGRVQVRALSESLRGERLDLILVSGLLRARETAALLAPTVQAPEYREDARLNEINLGEWEAVLESELLGKPAYTEWRADPLRHPPPAGEGALDVARRVAPLLDELAVRKPGSRILVVGHQYTNAVLACLMTGTPLDELRSRFTPPASLQRLTLPARPGPA